jgi:hypothetical protein
MRAASANHGQVRSESAGSTCATHEFLDRVTLSLRGRVTLVRLSRPEKRNAIDGRMIEGIRSAFACLPKKHLLLSCVVKGSIFVPAPTWANSRNTAGWIS